MCGVNPNPAGVAFSDEVVTVVHGHRTITKPLGSTWTDGGMKFDNGKPPMSLIDRHALEAIAQVLAFGANKYAAHNWRKGIQYSRLLDAALRHLYAFADGEDLDPESGLSHVAHAGCCIVFLLGMIQDHPELDDRHTTGDKHEA